MSRLKAARKELRLAQDALAKLRIAPDLDKLDESWVEFILCLERSWNKVRAEMSKHSKWQGWNDRGHIEQMRTSDPLIAYLRFARGAAEHGVADITVKQRGSWGIRPLGSQSLHIEKLVIGPAGKITELKANSPMEIVMSPAQLKLAPVKFRGVTYSVPTQHAGQPLASDPVTVASAGLAFYEGCLNRIDAAFPL